jgi:hypothetical protein
MNISLFGRIQLSLTTERPWRSLNLLLPYLTLFMINSFYEMEIFLETSNVEKLQAIKSTKKV